MAGTYANNIWTTTSFMPSEIYEKLSPSYIIRLGFLRIATISMRCQIKNQDNYYRQN